MTRPSISASGADALIEAAAAAYGAGRLDAAAALLERAEGLDPGDTRAPYAHAVIDIRLGRHAEARRRLKAVLRRQGDHFGALHNLGVAEQALGDWPAAVDAYDAALALNPAASDTSFALASALAVQGRIGDAMARYRELAKTPTLRARALTRLAVLRPDAIVEAEVASLQALAAAALSGDAGAAETRAGLLFALGGVLEARGETAAAWEAFARGNALKRRLLASGDPAGRPDVAARENAASIERVSRIFTAEFLAANAGAGDMSQRPIFIVGLPRSGSSLIEQIIASHPQVQGMGESGALWAALDGRFPYPPTAPPDADHFRELGRRYLASQRARGWRGAARLIDKTLDSRLHVGMILLMFPRAVILHAVRDPVDTGLACYRQLFATGNETLYDLADIGAEIRRCAAMMDHWRRVAPGRVTEVAYEDLVADPERQIRWLVTQACGLPWSEACLRSHETARPVSTASAEQVRRPIFSTSVGRWRRYEAQLGPLRRALDEAG